MFQRIVPAGMCVSSTLIKTNFIFGSRYLISAPNTFRYGIEETVSVSVFNVASPVRVVLYLQSYPDGTKMSSIIIRDVSAGKFMLIVSASFKWITANITVWHNIGKYKNCWNLKCLCNSIILVSSVGSLVYAYIFCYKCKSQCNLTSLFKFRNNISAWQLYKKASDAQVLKVTYCIVMKYSYFLEFMYTDVYFSYPLYILHSP